MITWFSVVAFRARRATLGLGLGLGFGLGLGWVGLARADAPASPLAPTAAAPVGAKVRARQELAEARLAAARAAAGAGRTADARALFGQALAAGLAAYGQAAADADAPRPTSVTSLANEQLVEEESAPPAASPPVATSEATAEDEAAAEARRAAEEERVARARAAAAEAKREEEGRRQALAPAPVPAVVATAPVPLPPAPPPTFQVGLRGALSARDPAGGHHVGGGLVFTWLTFATARGRGAAVVDLESTRWRSGRNDTMDRAQVAFYGLGFDWTVPFASRGTGVFFGAEATAGVLQSSTMTASAVQTDAVLQLMPHVGGAVAYQGVGLFADAGWRLQVRADAASGKASEGGLVLQGGLRAEMPEGRARDSSGVELGYAARICAPNGSAVYSRYGGLPFASGSGPLLEHELTVTTNARLPRHADGGLALTYLGADQAGGGPGLHIVGLGAVGTWHAFATRQVFNPYAGLRLGLAYISSGDASTFRYSKQVGAVASGMAGVDVSLHRRVTLRLGVAYDAVAYANDVSNASLSGYALEGGVVIRP